MSKKKNRYGSCPWAHGIKVSIPPETVDIWTSGTVIGNEVIPSEFLFDKYEKAREAAKAFYWLRRRKQHHDNRGHVVVLQKRARPDIFGCEWYIVDMFDDFLVDLDIQKRKEVNARYD